jgi:hypothetical protein
MKKRNRKKNLTRREEIYARFKKWSLSVSFHCYPKIFARTSLPLRLLWILFLVVFSILTFKLVFRGIYEYLEYDVVSKIRAFNEKLSPFPTITICNANPFGTREAEVLIKNAYDQPKNEEIFDNELLLKSSQLDLALMNMEYNKNIVLEHTYNMTDEDKRKLGFSIQQIQSCYFNEVECNFNEDFNWFYSFKWGSCYQFNSGKNSTLPLKQTKLGGRNYGLGLFIGPLYNLNKYPTYHSTGLRIFVHNNSFLSSSADEILVETGKHSSISIKKTFTYKTPMPHSQCQDLSQFDSDLYNYIKVNHVEYRQKDCFELCLQKMIIDNCSCFYTWLPIYGLSSQPCSSIEFKCLASVFNEVKDEIETICAPQCPLECNYVAYDLTMSSLSFPNKEFYDALKLNASQMSLNEYRQSHLGLDIFFPIKQYTEISETPKITFVDLVSSIGGALGVFLGLSVFSFIEISEIIIHVLYLLFKKRRKPNQSETRL